MISPAELQRTLEYDPDTGKFRWLRKPDASPAWLAKYAGKEAFTADHGNGYRRARVNGKSYMAHRVAWAMFHGAWPVGVIDHINGVRDDNRIVNLRDVTHAQNSQNRIRGRGTSSFVGVILFKRTGKWVAQMQIGTFDTEQEAADAYRAAKLKVHG